MAATAPMYGNIHDPIIEIDTWQRVQDKLKASKVRNANGTNFCNPSLLAGLIKNSKGHPLTPSHANKHGKRYRYYITKVNDPSSLEERYPAEQIENAVINELLHLLNDDLPTSQLSMSGFEGNREDIINKLRKGSPSQKRVQLQKLTHSIILSEKEMTLKINIEKDKDEETEDKLLKISVPIKFKKGLRGKKIIIPSGRLLLQKPDQKLISLIAKAHLYVKDFQSGKYKSITELATKHKINKSDFGKQIRLAYLAPDIIISILEGRQPSTLNATYLRKLKNLPAVWAEQRQLLHFT